MNKIQALLLASCVSTLCIEAQDSGCLQGRYVNHIFSEVNVIRDLPYGEALTMGGRSQSLLLDFYEPQGDNLEERPLVIMAHGGAFLGGDRSQTAEFCEDFAKRGYVCANIEYRLLDVLVFDSTSMIEVAFMASNDMRAAVRYFKEDASKSNDYGISTAQVFVAGVSAGAIMASHVGFLDTLDQVPEYIQELIDKHGGFEGNSSENTQYPSKVEGVLNYSGALTRSHWIDADDPPLYSVHDDQDQVVPCNYNTTSLLPFPVYLYGSCAMKTVADQMNLSNELDLVLNSAEHVSYFKDSSARKAVLDESAVFLSSIICQGSTGFNEKSLAKHPEISIYPNPFGDVLHIKSEARIQEISVTGITGQTYLLLDNFSGGSLQLMDLPAGLYLIRIKTKKGIHILKAIKE